MYRGIILLLILATICSGCKTVPKFKCDTREVVSQVMLKEYGAFLAMRSNKQEEVHILSRLSMDAGYFGWLQFDNGLKLLESTDNISIENRLDSIFPFTYTSLEDRKDFILGPYLINYFQFSPILRNGNKFYIMLYYLGGSWHEFFVYELEFTSDCELENIIRVNKIYEFYDES